MANHLTNGELLILRAKSEALLNDKHVGEEAYTAIQRIDGILAERKKKAEAVAAAPLQQQPSAPAPNASEATRKPQEPPPAATVPTTPQPQQQSATAAHTTATQQQPTAEVPPQQPAAPIDVPLEINTDSLTVTVDGKAMRIGEVRSKVITYLTHCSNSKTAGEENWGLFINSQSFKMLVFWMTVLGKFPLQSSAKFPLRSDVGDHFRSNCRKNIYSLAVLVHNNPQKDLTHEVNSLLND